MIRNRLLNYWYQFLDSKRADQIHLVDEGLEILHLRGTFQNHRQLVTRDATVIKEHSVYDLGVEELASFSQALAIAITQMIVLKAESFSVDFIEDGQGHIQVLQTTLHVLDSRVDLLFWTLNLFEVFLHISLLHPLLVHNIVRKSIRHFLQSPFVLFLSMVDARPDNGFLQERQGYATIL